MNIQDIKSIFPKDVIEKYDNDVKRLMELFMELKLDQYPINVTIQRYYHIDEISSVELELVKDLAEFHYSFGDNSEFESAILRNGTMFEKLYINPIQYDDESDTEFIERCKEEGTYSFDDILNKTKEVVEKYKNFVDSLERNRD